MSHTRSTRVRARYALGLLVVLAGLLVAGCGTDSGGESNANNSSLPTVSLPGAH